MSVKLFVAFAYQSPHSFMSSGTPSPVAVLFCTALPGNLVVSAYHHKELHCDLSSEVLQQRCEEGGSSEIRC